MGTPQDEALFGRWLRRRRRVADLTQKALARRVGCSAATIRKIEADERHPSRGLALALARALGVPEAERAAFVRFARHGWADRPPDAARASDVDRPWAVPARTTPAATPPAAAARALAERGQQERADAERGRAVTLLSGLAAQLPTEELRTSFAGVQRQLLSARADRVG